jgi:DNA-binding Lrp family transcriptional regulator
MRIVMEGSRKARSSSRYPVLARGATASKLACHGARFLALWQRNHRRNAMVPFFVQFKCKLGQSYAVANALAEAEIASEIYSTAGDYDLLVKFYVDNATDIGHFVNEKIQIIPGIQDTHTIITFKAFGTT